MTLVAMIVLVSFIMLAVGYVLGRRKTLEELESLAERLEDIKSHLTESND